MEGNYKQKNTFALRLSSYYGPVLEDMCSLSLKLKSVCLEGVGVWTVKDSIPLQNSSSYD